MWGKCLFYETFFFTLSRFWLRKISWNRTFFICLGFMKKHESRLRRRSFEGFWQVEEKKLRVVSFVIMPGTAERRRLRWPNMGADNDWIIWQRLNHSNHQSFGVQQGKIKNILFMNVIVMCLRVTQSSCCCSGVSIAVSDSVLCVLSTPMIHTNHRTVVATTNDMWM